MMDPQLFFLFDDKRIVEAEMKRKRMKLSSIFRKNGNDAYRSVYLVMVKLLVSLNACLQRKTVDFQKIVKGLNAV